MLYYNICKKKIKTKKHVVHGRDLEYLEETQMDTRSMQKSSTDCCQIQRSVTVVQQQEREP